MVGLICASAIRTTAFYLSEDAPKARREPRPRDKMTS
jgi:hypothetical protein